ncbi:MAG TPA: acyl-CoA dehydrogenase [Methanomicrobia archaeon]|nr:acyl-CoA dehydrogenase [Methanomicrobia archaeon]HEX59354.1 acyl-CoA dehydrogenase [Methanomicrobia archaeon]
MKFELDEEQKTIKEAVREFAEKEIKPRGREFDKSGEFPFEILRKAAKLGYIAVWIPEEYGGAGLGMLENAIIAEEFARADSGIGYAISLTAIGCPMVYRFGTEEQKEKYLPRIPKGESISFLGVTEPDAGSDVAAMKTVARKEGDEYVISGSKMFITNAKIADWGVVFAKTVPEAGHRGISAFIVETSTEGFEATPIEKMGRHCQDSCDVVLRDVRVPAKNLVGEENRGFYHLMETFNETRTHTAAVHVGIAQGAFDRALEYSKQREAFGRKICEFQAIQHKLANMLVKIETARLLVYKAASMIDAGFTPTKWTSMAKLVAGEVAVEVCLEAMQILGGHGYAVEYDVECFFRDGRAGTMVEGTSEIQRNILANIILGKLPEVKKRSLK